MGVTFNGLVILSLLFPIISAFPFTIGRRAVSQDLLNQLSFFEQYSAAAYCPNDNEAGPNTAITCSAGNCPEVQAANAKSVLEFENVGVTDATGFVAVDNTNQEIVIAFRGSESIRNYIADLVFVQEPWSLCSGCNVHTGFLTSWNEVRSDIIAAVDNATAANPSYKIISTGHSLGAALATVAAADLRNAGYTISLYTYGSPMVGNVALAQFITAQSTENFRVTHENDIVPKLPGYSLGFAHISPEYWITSANNDTVTANDIQVSSGVADVDGNEGTLTASVADHLFYFNRVTACLPEGIEF